MNVTDSIKYIGVYDQELDLFEGQYPLRNGVTYNSYIIIDDKIAIMDTVDRRGKDIWLENVEKALNGREPDYLVVSHMEPDHGACVQYIAEKFPNMKIVGNVKTFAMIDEYFDFVKANGYFEYRRNEQAKYWMYESINEHLRDSFYNNETIAAMLPVKENEVLNGRLTSFIAAKKLLDAYYGGLKG